MSGLGHLCTISVALQLSMSFFGPQEFQTQPHLHLSGIEGLIASSPYALTHHTQWWHLQSNRWCSDNMLSFLTISNLAALLQCACAAQFDRQPGAACVARKAGAETTRAQEWQGKLMQTCPATHSLALSLQHLLCRCYTPHLAVSFVVLDLLPSA